MVVWTAQLLFLQRGLRRKVPHRCWKNAPRMGASAGEPVKALSGVIGLTYPDGFATAGAASASGVAALAAPSGDYALAVALAPPMASFGGFSVWREVKSIVFKVVMRLLSWLCKLSWPLVNSAT